MDSLVANAISSIDEMIVYLHVAKTAGTTMLHYFESQCKTWHAKTWWTPTYWDVPDDTECLFSHCPYGEPEKHVLGKHQYVTFLRDPVDRVISKYFHFLNAPAKMLHREYVKYSLREIVNANRFATFENGIVRVLSGRSDIGDMPPQSEVTREDLERAKANLSTFALVGFVETFNHDLVRLADLFGWTDLSYKWYRKGERPPAMAFRSDVLEAIRERNQFDIELVEFAKNGTNSGRKENSDGN